jgi:hypothetical protein
MQHGPGGLIAAQAQNPLQAQGANSVLSHRPKPDRQRQMAVLKNRPRRDRHLVVADGASPAIPPHAAGRRSRTTWTCPSPRPSKHCRILDAGIFAAETFLQLKQSPRIIPAHGSKHDILGSVSSSKYPYRKMISRHGLPPASSIAVLEDAGASPGTKA